jgi:hypothetical protein
MLSIIMPSEARMKNCHENLEPSCSFSWHRLLRRTLRGSVHWASSPPTNFVPSLRFAREPARGDFKTRKKMYHFSI